VIAEPPLYGADHVTTAAALAGAAATEPGASGVVLGVTDAGDDAVPLPTAFVANTVTEYATPLVRPVIVHVVAGAVAVQNAPPGLAVAV
jgi:hypothetical protein